MNKIRKNEFLISIKEKEIEPKKLRIDKGGVVNWVNCSNHICMVVFRTGDFESGDLKRGESFRLVFDSAGVYNYYCEEDEEMTGEIIVE